MAVVVPVWLGYVTDTGVRRLQDPQGFAAYCQTFQGKPFELVMRAPRARSRSQQANAYYWAVVVTLLAEFCGYEPQDMHDVLAMKFLRIEDDTITGAPRRRRTPHCDSKEFAVYVDQCRRLGAELGIYIPDPHEAEG